MSAPTSIPRARRRSNADLVIAAVGVIAAAAWFVLTKTNVDAVRAERSKQALENAQKLIAGQQELIRARVLGAAQMLPFDNRTFETLRSADGADAESIKATLIDSYKEIEQLDGFSLHGALNPSGKVLALVGKGVDALGRSDLGDTQVVRQALKTGKGATGTWLLDGHLFEVAAAPLTLGERPKAVCLVGQAIDDATLGSLSRAAHVQLALTAEGKLLASSSTSPEDAAAFATVLSGGVVAGRTTVYADIPNAFPSARLLLLTEKESDDGAINTSLFAALGLSLIFAVLAFWRLGK